MVEGLSTASTTPPQRSRGAAATALGGRKKRSAEARPEDIDVATRR
jgi:hypothetical protein